MNIKKNQRKFSLKQGDIVQVIAGKDKGKTGKILKIEKVKDRLYVEGVSLQKKHQKPTQRGQKGKRVEKEGAIHYSNVLLYNPRTKKGERFYIKQEEKNKKRIFVSERFKKSQNVDKK